MLFGTLQLHAPTKPGGNWTYNLTFSKPISPLEIKTLPRQDNGGQSEINCESMNSKFPVKNGHSWRSGEKCWFSNYEVVGSNHTSFSWCSLPKSYEQNKKELCNPRVSFSFSNLLVNDEVPIENFNNAPGYLETSISFGRSTSELQNWTSNVLWPGKYCWEYFWIS